MKELNFEQMENVQGGNCFVVGACAVVFAAWGVIGLVVGAATGGWDNLAYCLNS